MIKITSKELPRDELTKYEPFSKKRMVAFALGNVSLHSMWNAINNIQLYAEKALGVPILFVTVIMAIFVIWDAVDDPISGYVLDRSTRFTSKYGKRFPFIVIGFLGASVLLFFIFFPYVYVGNIILIVIALTVMICLFDGFQTLFQLSYGSLQVDFFRTQKERVRFGVNAQYLGLTFNIIFSVVGPLLLAAFGGAEDQQAYFLSNLVRLPVTIIAGIMFIWSAKEPKDMIEFRAKLDEDLKTTPFTFKSLVNPIKDRNWMALVVGYLFWLVAMGCLTVGSAFYILDTLGLSISFMAVPLLLYIIGSIASIPIAKMATIKFGTKNTYFYILVATGLSLITIIFSMDIVSFSILVFLAGLFSGGQLVIISTVYSESIDYATVKTSVREEGNYLGSLRFFSATSLLWQVLIFAIVATITGYDPLLGTNNTFIAKFGLLLQISIIPGILVIIGGIIFYKYNVVTREVATENKKRLIEQNI